MKDDLTTLFMLKNITISITSITSGGYPSSFGVIDEKESAGNRLEKQRSMLGRAAINANGRNGTSRIQFQPSEHARTRGKGEEGGRRESALDKSARGTARAYMCITAY